MPLQLLVFDFDGTILSTDDHCLRPYFCYLVGYLHRHKIRIAMWTAANIEWVRLHFTPLIIGLFDFIWDSRTIKFDRKDFVVKPLRKLHKHKHRSIRSNKRNTLIVDDTPSTYQLNKRNAIPIKSFKQRRDINDDHFLYLIIALEMARKHIRKIHFGDNWYEGIKEYMNPLSVDILKDIIEYL